MDWVEALGDINYLAILAAAVASFVLGSAGITGRCSARGGSVSSA